MDSQLRTELRDAEQTGDYQRLYWLLHRAGRPADAQKLFLDHPITVECVVCYRYEAHCTVPRRGYYTIGADTIPELVDNIIIENIGSNLIVMIRRIPYYRLLGGEISDLGSIHSPLPAITLESTEQQAIRDLVRQHPNYLRHASQADRIAAQEADERRALEARREAEVEEMRASLRRLKQELDDAFQIASARYQDEIWDLWEQYRHLPRKEFAEQMNQHQVGFVGFLLRDFQESHPLTPVTPEVLGQIWRENHDRRYRNFQKMRRSQQLAS